MVNQDYKNENIETIYLKDMENNQLLRIKNSLLELEKYFLELKDIKLKNTKEKN